MGTLAYLGIWIAVPFIALYKLVRAAFSNEKIDSDGVMALQMTAIVVVLIVLAALTH